MDTLSHALWGYASLRWRGPRSAKWGALLGAAPDLIFGGLRVIDQGFRYGWGTVLDTFGGVDPAVWRREGPPLPEKLVSAYHHFYVYTHSLVLLALLALGWYLVRRRPPWLLLPCLLHILMDIPSHERYLTPFLFPLSSFVIEGYSWGRPPMLIANWGGLLIAYGLLFWRYWRPGRPPRQVPWPEEVTGVA